MQENKLVFELVLPCYNEAKSLEFLVERGARAAMDAGLNSDQFQLVLVENGSKDNSAQVLSLLKETPLGAWFRIVKVEKNQGYGFGLSMGLKSATAPFVGYSHADQQCDPKDAFTALSLLQSSSREGRKLLVKGVRNGRNWKDIFVSRIFELFSRLLLGFGAYETNAQPKVFPHALLGKLENPPKSFAFDLYLLYCAKKAGYEFQTIPVHFPPRVHGVSNWTSTFLGRYKTILGMIRYMYVLGRTEGRA